MRVIRFAIAAAVLMAATGQAKAGLIGTDVQGFWGNASVSADGIAPGYYSSPTAVIGAGAEFTGSISDSQVLADFDPSTSRLRIEFVHVAPELEGSHQFLGFGTSFAIDWGVSGGSLTGFTLIAGNTLPITNSGFTANSLDVEFTGLFFGRGVTSLFAEFQITSDMPQTVTPEPTSLALTGFAGIGMAVGAWRRRRQQKSAAA